MAPGNTANKLLLLLTKDFNSQHTITSTAISINMSRVGIWKKIKKMEEEELITLQKTGTGKTSIINIKLKWENPMVEKMISLALLTERKEYRRWADVFAGIADKTEFLILYGSILRTPKESSDIDLLGIIKDGSRSEQIEKELMEIQKTQIKKVHLEIMNEQELNNEIKKENHAFIEAIKNGIVLYGENNYIKTIMVFSEK